MWIQRADLTWYIVSTSRSFHLSARIELSLKSPSDGNPVGGGTVAVASALSWPMKSVRLGALRLSTVCIAL